MNVVVLDSYFSFSSGEGVFRGFLDEVLQTVVRGHTNEVYCVALNQDGS